MNDGTVRAFLFADLRDYTAFVEREGDRAAAELITNYRALIREHLAQHEGAELKTEGDSFYIVFPSPSRAVAFGVDVFRAAHADGARRIRFGVGIHVGETVPLDGQFVGSAVNLAARVGAMAADGEILVTDTVRGLIRTSSPFSYDDRGTVTLKGVPEPVHLYAVDWRPPQEAPQITIPPVAEAPTGAFVGRDAELAALVAAAAALGESRGAIVLVGGAAGLGKTRLLRQWAARSDVTALVGACGATDARPPYEPFIGMLRRLTRVPTEEARLRRVAPELIAFLPELATGERQRQADRDVLFGAMLRLIRDVARGRPIALVVEDLHWADDGTLALLQFLASLAETTPFLLIATYRDDELPRGHPVRPVLAELARLKDVIQIALRPLAASDAEQLLAHTRGAAAMSGTDRERIITLAEGNPLFLEELARSAAQPNEALPLTIAEAVLRRVATLDEEGRRLITYAAASGQQIGFDLLERVLDLPEREVLRAAKAAVGASLLVESGESLAFRHALTREAVYRDLMKRERRLLHLELAEALVALHGIDPSWAAEIERQFADAGAPDRALPYAIAAGEEASRLLAPGEAVAHFERAIDASGARWCDRARALLGLGNAYRLQLQVTKAVTTLKEAVALYREVGAPPDVARAQSALARAHPFGRDEWAAWRAAWDAHEAAGLGGDVSIATSIAARAYEFMDDAEAERWADTALQLARRSGSPEHVRNVEVGVMDLRHPPGWHVAVERDLAQRLDRALDRDENVLTAYRRYLDSRSREADADERLALLARARSYGASHAPGVPRTLTFRAGPPWMLWLAGQWDDLAWLWSELQRRFAGDDVADIFPDTGPLAEAARVEREGPARAGDGLRAAAHRQARSGTWHAQVASTSHRANVDLAGGRAADAARELAALFGQRTPQALELPPFVLAARVVAPAALLSGDATCAAPWIAADPSLREEGPMFAAGLDHVRAAELALAGDAAGARSLLGGAAATYSRLGWEHLAADLAWQRAAVGDPSGLAAARAFYGSRGAEWRVGWLDREGWR
ncbi:MAG: ATP-binding protein [Candidatus Limnocylindria bacterium]